MVENSVCVQELWQRYEQHKKVSDKNELVMHYMPTVKKTVLHLLNSYRAYLSYDDMVSCGVIGLMDAIEKYDPARDARFETYSAVRIRGEIIDSIRAQDWASDSLRRRIKAAARARSELHEKLGREPGTAEVAAQMNISETALRGVLDKNRAFSVVYFEDMALEDDAWEQRVPDSACLPEEIAESNALAETLGCLIDVLPEKERLVISLYYYEELTQKEIAQILGVTEARVCQIRASAVTRLKAGMQRAWAVE